MTGTSRDHGSNTDRPLYVVLGATGGVGRAVVAEAAIRGHRVRPVSRSATAATDLPAGVEPMDADLRTPDGAAAAVAGAEVVVHAVQPPYTRWAAEFPPLTRRIADAAAAAGAKLMMAENLYMYGPQPGGRPMTEDTAYAATDSRDWSGQRWPPSCWTGTPAASCGSRWAGHRTTTARTAPSARWARGSSARPCAAGPSTRWAPCRPRTAWPTCPTSPPGS